VKKLVSKFAFQVHNLQRYIEFTTHVPEKKKNSTTAGGRARWGSAG
jgi:hypothetical protein